MRTGQWHWQLNWKWRLICNTKGFLLWPASSCSTVIAGDLLRSAFIGEAAFGGVSGRRLIRVSSAGGAPKPPPLLPFYLLLVLHRPLAGQARAHKHNIIHNSYQGSTLTFWNLLAPRQFSLAPPPKIVIGCAHAFDEHNHCSLTYIFIIYFCPPKPQSIFGLHREPRCQKFRLGSD